MMPVTAKWTNCNILLSGVPYTGPLYMTATADLDTSNPKIPFGGMQQNAVNGRIQVTWPDCAPSGGATATYYTPTASFVGGRIFIPVSGQVENGTEGGQDIALEPSAVPFPRPGSNKGPLGPQEPGDSFGQTYYTLPPEFLAQPGMSPVAANVDLIRGNAFTFTTMWAPQDVNPMCTFAWLQSIGQNTNYGMTMWFTPLLVLYPVDVQNRFLADYATYHTHLMIALYPNLGGTLAQIEDLGSRARAQGLFVCYVTMDPTEIQVLAAAKAVDVIIIGLEANKQPPEIVDAVTRQAAAIGVPLGIRVWVHLLSTGGPNDEQQWGIYDYVPWWASMAGIGVSGLMYETYMTYEPDPTYLASQGADPTQLGDSAGKMGAMAFYARTGLYQANPILKFCHGETWSAPPFDGNTDEMFAARRNFEMMCCPDGGQANAVSGYFNGARYPDGSVI